MRTSDAFIGQLEDYLNEFDGDTPLPARVADTIHAELPRTGQAKASPRLMRMLPMSPTISSRAPWRLAAAAVVVAVVIGALLLDRGNAPPDVGAGPQASVSAPPSETAGPTASPAYPTLQSGKAAPCPGITDLDYCLEPGTYVLGSTSIWPGVVTLDVPENWWLFQDGSDYLGVLVQTHDTQNGSGWGIIFTTVGTVSKDPCDKDAGTVDTGIDARLLADLVAAWPGFEATTLERDPNAGDAARFSLSTTKTARDCPGAVMWTTASGVPIDAYPMVDDHGRGRETEFRIFDIGGELLAVMAMTFSATSPFEEFNGHAFDPEAHAEHLVALRAILESIRVEAPTGGAS